MERECKKIEELTADLLEKCRGEELFTRDLEAVMEFLYDNAALFGISGQDFREIAQRYSDEGQTQIAKDTLEDFQNSTDSISDITKLNIQEVEKIISNERIDLSGLKTKVSSFHNEIFDELEKANKRIETLQKEIHSLENEVNLDHLTKLYNRKTLIEDINHLISTARQKSEAGFSIIIIDLDDFKLINDKNGHLAGDKVLIYVAKLLKSLVRQGTKVYRFGGEEFIIVLNRTDLDEAVKVANRTVKSIAKNKLKFKDSIITITASLGVTKYTEGDNYETLFQRADKAMYEAKSKGKSRVEIG
ncbi:MAG: GGDEF domain-containing protein [Campylobacterota bacterium]